MSFPTARDLADVGICGEDCFTPDLDRRAFGSVMLGAGIVAAAGSAQAETPIMETEVTIKTTDGTCDAVFVHPKTGSHPAVLIWTDAFGLRPAFRQMGARLAAEGYAVLIPNPFYRTAKAPVFPPGLKFDVPEDRERIMAAVGPLMESNAAERDATAFTAFLDTHAAVKKAKKIGTTGYCMGGPLTMRTAAMLGDRVGAAASFHGGMLVTDKPDSPHLLVPKIKAKYMFAIGQNDDTQQPDAKDVLRKAFQDAKNPADIAVYAADHGWCVPDVRFYKPAEAERAWAKLLTFFKKHLA